jgi:6,7-dimethyl-8-ribityllumazine synthase
MPRTIEGELQASGKHVAVVASRFNDFVTKRLVEGAVDCLTRHGSADKDIEIYWVPGSFEIPQIAAKLSEKKQLDGVLCLGTIIRGETPHFDILSATVIRSLEQAAQRSPVPLTFGIVTADTLEQAIDRAGSKHGNKGWQSALALIEMMKLWEKLI